MSANNQEVEIKVRVKPSQIETIKGKLISFEAVSKEKIRERDVKEGIELIKKTDSYQKVNLTGRKFAEKAKARLSRLPQNRWNDILREIADSVMEREK